MREQRDIADFSELVAARSGALFRTAYLVVGDYQLAQDLLHEALVKTLIAWPRLRDPAKVDAYDIPTTLLDGRPLQLRVPKGYDADTNSFVVVQWLDDETLVLFAYYDHNELPMHPATSLSARCLRGPVESSCRPPRRLSTCRQVTSMRDTGARVIVRARRHTSPARDLAIP